MSDITPELARLVREQAGKFYRGESSSVDAFSVIDRAVRSGWHGDAFNATREAFDAEVSRLIDHGDTVDVSEAYIAQVWAPARDVPTGDAAAMSRGILTSSEHAALRVLCRRHIRRLPEGPMPSVVSALRKLETMPAGYPARIATASLRPLEFHDAGTRELLTQRLAPVIAEMVRIAEDFGAGDPGAAEPSTLMGELLDATYDRFQAPGAST